MMCNFGVPLFPLLWGFGSSIQSKCQKCEFMSISIVDYQMKLDSEFKSFSSSQISFCRYDSSQNEVYGPDENDGDNIQPTSSVILLENNDDNDQVQVPQK